MKFNNILVVLNPDNEKQYALARAVRLVKEQQNETKVKITTLLSVYDLSYEMSALLSSEERSQMHKTAIEQQRQAVQFYLDKYADPEIEFESHIVWSSNEADAIREEVEKNQYDLVVKYTKDEESFTSLIFTPVDWQLLRKCPIPVLMVRDGDWKHQRRILVAVNVSGEQEYQDEFNQELVSLEKRIDEIDSIFTKLIEQNALGKITDERFSKMSMNYETEQAEVVQSYRELKSKIKSEEEKVQGTDRFLETISKYKDVTELNRSMLCELIDSIYVYQAEGIGKERTQKVEINYRFLAVSH